MTVVVDYGMCNVGSITNMCRRLGVEVTVSSKATEIWRASRIIIPGVGSFDQGIESLKRLALIEVLHEKVMGEGTPVLGICLGMQLMTTGSDEGQLPGLGWIPARAKKFSAREQSDHKVPHMGWNEVNYIRASNVLSGLATNARYYFVHSYYVECAQPGDVLATCDYGVRFAAAIERGKVVGVQFHPEKSHRYGTELLSSFVRST